MSAHLQARNLLAALVVHNENLRLVDERVPAGGSMITEISHHMDDAASAGAPKAIGLAAKAMPLSISDVQPQVLGGGRHDSTGLFARLPSGGPQESPARQAHRTTTSRQIDRWQSERKTQKA